MKTHKTELHWTLTYAYLLQIPLEVAEPLDHKKLDGLKLGMSGDHQLVNSGLAVSLCKCWLQRTGNLERMFLNVGLIFIFYLMLFMVFLLMVSFLNC